MKCRYLALITTSCILATLAGCAGTAATNYSHSADATQSRDVRAMPVFVIPKCQALAGEQRCFWIEPRGYQPGAPEPASTQRIQGIAL